MTKFRRKDATAWRRIADEMIVVALETREMFGMNTSAAAIWTLLEFGVSVDDLVGKAPESEMAVFFEELLQLELITACPKDAVDEARDRCEALLAELEIEESPRVLWREEIRKVSASCAFFPATNPLCNQVPFG